MSEIPNAANDYLSSHVRLLAESYRRFVGDTLMESADPETTEFAQRVFEAPFVVLSHGTESDPIFNYANQTAMKLFEMNWATITALPSRKSAEPMNRAERDRLLAAVAKQNFIDDYSGVRISSTGRRFFIPKAIVWNLVDDHGERCGQAATFSEWHYID